MTAGESPSLLPQRAADKLERLAQGAPQPPWRTSGDVDLLAYGPTPAVYTGYGDVEVQWAPGMLEWVMAMTPAVAVPLVTWLRKQASHYDALLEMAEGDVSWMEEWHTSPSFEFARAVLGLSVEEETT